MLARLAYVCASCTRETDKRARKSDARTTTPTTTNRSEPLKHNPGCTSFVPPERGSAMRGAAASRIRLHLALFLSLAYLHSIAFLRALLSFSFPVYAHASFRIDASDAGPIFLKSSVSEYIMRDGVAGGPSREAFWWSVHGRVVSSGAGASADDDGLFLLFRQTILIARESDELF